MGKNRKSKRQLVRDEKRAKKRGREHEDEEEKIETKRQRTTDFDAGADYIPLDDNEHDGAERPIRGLGGGPFEREFFGMLEEQEQEFFRRADELLEQNDFPSTYERDEFLQNVYKESVGKELKLASSQSCSRLMERLILLSSARQKKTIFNAFAGHFISLITHRFSSHCCEQLFLQSAPTITRELTGEVEPEPEVEGDEPLEPQASMEELFLLTLDELEEHLGYLVSDRYGSHALRALLIVLSGRPLDQAGTKSLLRSKKKEHITAEGAVAMGSEFTSQARAVPSSFATAIQKIITDSTATLDATALRVLAKHPTGNPTLQLLLELEFGLTAKAKKAVSKKKKKGEDAEDERAEKEEEEQPRTLLEQLIPDAPVSFSDEKSQAAEFVNSMLYDAIGSRLLETLITHCPGKIFKGLHAHFFGPRIQSLLRNDTASYAAIRVLNRLSKEDLADAVEKSLPHIAGFVEKGRLNVIKTLFERCHVRQANDALASLLKALTTAVGGDWKHLVPKLCPLPDDEAAPAKKPADKSFQPPSETKNKPALLLHACNLLSTLLSIPGAPAKALQASLLALPPAHLQHLATASAPTAALLAQALSTPSAGSPHFHKVLVAGLAPAAPALAVSPHGAGVLNAVIDAPSRGEAIAVPFHLKENIMAQLEGHERELKDTWPGRGVWRAWRGDLWGYRRHDWVRWAKEADAEGARVAGVPRAKEDKEGGRRRKMVVVGGGGKKEEGEAPAAVAVA
ncbi:armadillo-type protein [Schizothecium vesticola]|uniref:Nucleolar protein 9 n=1 Tax=Schizothecium vesticola TaxID=314040 RepID=A0AA40F274_9PEZI|nr:armadillo-type protein [Schizothecium vesticola]